ncbi:hypothetical protein [Rosettibacter firmus]|uniref:hypothetical protein n=1 Tax=Rosettibacter firmus TaxID=3111522 RepID=UPI00336BCF4B
MEINGYNDDELKFIKLLKDLKELPKIKAEDNFEYNLMIRIQNGNFGNLEEEFKPRYGIIKFIIPSAIVSIIILFILFFPTNEQVIDNPLMSDPPKISEKENIDNSQIFSSNVEQITTPKLKVKKGEIQSGSTSKKSNTSTNPAIKYPINQTRSVSLDEYISGENARVNNLQRGTVVSSGEEVFEFDRFLMPQQLDKESIEKYRRMIDSIKKAEAKRDSIRRSRYNR